MERVVEVGGFLEGGGEGGGDGDEEGSGRSFILVGVME